MNKLFNLSDFQDLFIYRVEEGDTLRSIGDKFHAAETALISLNALTQEVSVGDVLLVERTNGIPYIVKPGDSLESITNGDKNKIFEIVNKNKTDVIYVGQKIYI